MKLAAEKGDTVSDRLAVYFMVSFRQLCLLTVSLPLIALLVCFITAVIFQPDDVHETHCRVYNIIPSISAITGVSPQRYLWRICVALHIGPRFIIASVCHTYHQSLFRMQPDPRLQQTCNRWLNITYWLNILEISSLCGVTYVSNRENYPLHEKIFITFMVGSLTHMLANIKVLRLAAASGVYENPAGGMSITQSIFVKQLLFVTSIGSSVGLVIFFLKHRLFCHDLAFSYFALCEYLIATANMAFHITVIFDFPTEKLVVARGFPGIAKESVWKLD